MKADLKKQDKILSTIGLKHLMGVQPCDVTFYSLSNFKYYVTSEYKNSKRKETDECYRMDEFNLLHIHSGLRLTLTEHEGYFGDTFEYKIIRMFIITLFGKELEVIDADFGNEIFYTTDSEIPFAETYKPIAFEDKDDMAPHFTKEELEEMRTEGMTRAIIELQLGMRKPKNKQEERLLKQIKEGEAKGYIFDLPLE